MTAVIDEEDYCGCCGDVIPRLVDDATGVADIVPWWCDPCKGHVGTDGPPWERTHQALTGEPCPWQV
jgi:hypothetical protein